MSRALRFALFFAVVIGGCSEAPVAPPDTGPSPVDTGTRCHADAECSDGMFCNGAERCLADGGGDTRGCAPALAANPCATGQVCDETADRCMTTCADADGDGHMASSCGGDDCDDADPHTFPGNTEVCAFDATTMMRIDPTHDEDCNAMTYANGTAADGDHDGDGFVDATCLNRDTNGNTFRGNDCADLAPVMAMTPFTGTTPAANVHPTEAESCNGVDDDCNGMIDDGLTVHTYYADCDGDLFGDMAAVAMPGCSAADLPACMGHLPVLDHTDCNDASSTAHPGLTDVCDGADNDCNGTADDAAPANASCTTMFPTPAHGAVTCNSGACALTCTTGFGNCDTSIANGCEIDMRSNPLHCGTCARVCGGGASCTASVCEGASTIDAGPAHTCVLYTSGRAACWGRNGEGQLGDGSRVDRPVPTAVVAPVGGAVQTFSFISAGGLRTESATTISDTSHTCAGSSGGLFCWGRGNEGQLGNSLTASSSAPVAVANLPYSVATDTGPASILGVSVGGLHTWAFQRAPRLSIPNWSRWGWGTNALQELGLASPAQTSVPLQSGGNNECIDVAAGTHSSCYVSGTNGAVYCFGSSAYGEAPATSPIPSPYWANQIAAGGIVGSGTVGGFAQTSGAFACAILWSGAGGTGPVICWGANSEGQLGNGGTAGALVVGLTDAHDGVPASSSGRHLIAAGGRHACAIRASGAVVCWGHNGYGQLGNGTRTSSNRPVAVMGITNAIAIAAGAEHSCAVLADGTARCWGRNDHGQLGDGTTTDRITPTPVTGL
jgi:alpha-tubulin suppressor-like RCC1 family protein